MKSLTKKPLARMWRAIIEFDMIKENDHVLIGLSGGKDSLFMTWALSQIKQHAPFSFKLSAFTVDAGFSDDFPAHKLSDFCQKLDIKHYHEKVNISELIKQTGKSPCYTCAYFRRGATSRMAKTLGANRIALAHHGDDAVETFYMNIVQSGQLRTFLPVTWLSQKELFVIRPLLYYREKDIKEFVGQLDLKPIKNPCPHDGKTMRQDIKEQISVLEKINPQIYDNLFAAMRYAENIELLPQKLNKEEDMKKFHQFWHS